MRGKMLAGALAATVGLLGTLEGVKLYPYLDVGGVPTVCMGSTHDVEWRPYTARECSEKALSEVQVYWDGVLAKAPPETPGSVLGAMTSVAYNVGVRGWAVEAGRDSRFVLALRNKDWVAACAAITAPWQGRYGVSQGYKATVGGKPHKGLENRRAAEYNFCMEDLR